MPIAVPIVAGTAVKGLAAQLMTKRLLQRHPGAFLITLANFGVTIPLHNSQRFIAADIRKQLMEQGRPPDCPVVMVGHSQGGLACLRYALDHPGQVLHVITVGVPWHGSRSAALLSGLIKRTRINITPAINDMSAGSEFLRVLHDEIPEIGDRVTNIYSTRERVISPYYFAHINAVGVRNYLISTDKEYQRHLADFPEYPLAGHIEGKVNHLGEMSNSKVEDVIWSRVEEVTEIANRNGRGSTAQRFQ